MKRISILTLFLLFGLAEAAQSDDTQLPLHARISMEKQLLTENYQATMQRCSEHKSRAAKNSCNERNKDHFTSALEDLQHEPKTYFAIKEKNNRDEKTVHEARKRISSGEGL
jgi:hypothetical protein